MDAQTGRPCCPIALVRVQGLAADRRRTPRSVMAQPAPNRHHTVTAGYLRRFTAALGSRRRRATSELLARMIDEQAPANEMRWVRVRESP